MNIKINYFIYLDPNNWRTIFEEQMGALYNLQLYHTATQIYVSAVCDSTEPYLQLLQLIYIKYPKIIFGNFELGHHAGEFYGFKTLYDIADNDDNTILLHFHSKGISSGYDKTRLLMFEHTIKNYQTYIDAFTNNKEIQIAGAIINPAGFVYFTFFWVRGSYVKKYCKLPKFSLDRYIWELYTVSEYSQENKNITYSPYNYIANTADEAIHCHELLDNLGK